MNELENLYKVLVDQGLYTKSFNEFKQQYSDDQYKKKVFDVVKEKKLFTKEFSDFTEKYSEKKNDGFTLGKTDMDLPQKEDSSDISEPEEQETFQAKDYLGDFLGGAIDAGVRQGKTAEETMELIYKGDKISDEELQSYIKAVEKMEQDGPSEDMIEFQRIAEENGGGFGGFISALGTEGVGARAATEVALTSFSGMLSAAIDAKEEMAAGVGISAAAGAALGTTALPLAPVTAPAGAITGMIGGLFGTSGALLETSMSYTEFLKEELGDKDFNIQNIREVLQDEDAKNRIRNKALTRGGIIGLVDGMSAGLAGKAAGAVGKTFGKVGTKLGKAAKKTSQITASGIVEGVGGGAGEAAARLAVGQEMDATEIGFEAIGGAPKGLITGPIGVLRATQDSKPSFKINGETVPKDKAENVINTATPEQLTKINIEIKNDESLENTLKDKKERYKISEQLPDDIPDANREEIIDLEIKRKNLEGKNTVAAKQRIREIEAEIAEKTKATTEENVQNTEEATTETSEESKLTYDISRQTEVRVDESGKFIGAFEKKSGKERPRRTTKKSQDELIKQKDYTTGKSAFDDPNINITEEEQSELIAEKSENPKEIAQEYIKSKEEGEMFDPIVEAFVGNYQVSGKSFNEFSKSKDEVPKVLAYLKGDKSTKGMKKKSLDVIAQEISEQIGTDVDPQQLYEIMIDDRYKNNRLPKQSEKTINLRNRFIEVTGLLGTDDQIQKVAEQDPSQLKPATEPKEVVQEKAEDQKELEIEEKVEEATIAAKDKKAKSEDTVNEIGVSLFVNKIARAFNSIVNFITKVRKTHFSAKGLIPDIIYRLREKRDGNIRKYVNKINRTFKDVRRILKTIPKNQRQSVMEEFDLVLRGEKKAQDTSLSNEMIVVVSRMRSEIDGLSNMLMESGYFDAANDIKTKKDEGLNAILSNIGSYVNRSYRVFSDPNWSRIVSEEVKENARKFFRREAIKKGKTISEQEIEQKIFEILDKAEGNKFITTGKDGRMNKDIFKRRKDIPPEIRALMGEVENPLENYQTTILKQAQLLFNYQFQRQIVEAGTNTFFTKNRTEKNTVQIAKEGNDAYQELAGLWTTKEIADTFKKRNQMPGLIDTFIKINGTIKWLKTVGSVATHIKNLIGNHGFVLMNGHLNIEEFKKAGQNVIDEFYGLTNDQQKKYLDNLISLGIVKQSATLGDIVTAFSEKSFEEAYQKALTDQSRSTGKTKEGLANDLKYIQSLFKTTKAGKASKRLVDFLNDAYQSEDDLFKIVAYEVEKSRYADALFGKDKSNLTEDQQKKLDKIVAEIVKNTYPTYDRVPPIIKTLGRTPILGAFVSFKAESIRTAVNTYALAFREGRSKNSKIARIGANRLLSAGLYTSVKLAIASQFAMAVGSLVTGGKEDESEEYNDLKKFLPEWSKDSIIMMQSKEPGKYTYIDLTSNDPHAFMSEFVVAGRNEEDIFPAFIEKLQALGRPFLGKDLIFGFGEKVTKIGQSEKFSTEEKTEKIMTEFYKLLEPGTVSSLRRVGVKSYEKGEDRAFKELLGFTGFKPVDVDIEESFLFRVLDYKKDKDQYNSTYNRVRYNEKSTEEDLMDGYRQINSSYKQMVEELTDMTKSALRLGADYDNLRKILKDNGGFNKREIMFIMSDLENYEYLPPKKR